tara:strand:- start:1415 stop:2074 length:660 start_codon:yes stop_codon:yes gene_type:complete
MKVTYGKVWSTLSSVDCNNLKKEKNGLDYLSWASAWGILMKHYPDATYTFYDNDYESNGTVAVNCSVQIGECSRSMWLPVMDYRNKAISAPTSSDINKAKMRCLVKCIAMFGLGHYIYDGEDLPSVSDSPVSEKANAPQSSETLVSGGHILYNDKLKIPCGAQKGKHYEEVYNDSLVAVDNHINHFKGIKKLKASESLHLNQLLAYKRAINSEPSNGVA